MEYKYMFSLAFGLRKIKSIERFKMDENEGGDINYRIDEYNDYYRFDHYPKGNGFAHIESLDNDLSDETYFLLKDFDSLYRLIDKFIDDFGSGKE